MWAGEFIRGGSWHIVCVYTCRTFLNGVGELISRSQTLQAQLFATEGIPTFLWCCSKHVCYNKLRKAFKVSPWRFLSGDFDRGIPWSMTEHASYPPTIIWLLLLEVHMYTIYHTTSATLSHPEKLGHISESIFGNTNELRLYIPCLNGFC